MQCNIFEKLDYVANDEVSLYFFASDIVVLPYKSITQSGVLQIAYAFGKPVVATDLAGFSEAVVEGKNGYLFSYEDTQALSNILINLISDEAKIERMGDFSFFLSNNEFDWGKIANKTTLMYNQLLKIY